MQSSRISSQAGRWFEHSLLSTDAARALRSSSAMAAAWVLCLLTGQAAAVAVVAPTAQNVAMLDVRGDYRARIAILLTLTASISVSVLAGSVAGHGWISATLMIGLMALLAGCWRHLSGDYGPNFALASGLMFLISMSQHGDLRHGVWLMGLTALAGLGGLVVQMSGWFVRPQHALRHAVAETWVAVSDLITAMRTETDDGQPCLGQIAEKESALRTTADRTFHALAAAFSRRNPELGEHLDAATHVAARLATRVTAFHTALEAIRPRPGFGAVAPALDAALRSLANATRSAALTLLVHRQEQFVALEVRLRRVTDLLHLLDRRLSEMPGPDEEVTHTRQLLALVLELLPLVRTTLEETVDHGRSGSGIALRLPELGDMSMRALGSWVNPPTQLDWMLVRYTLRSAAVLMLAVAVYQWFHIPRGHWIAFTALVVLQPDYGATRQKAGQRLLGTLAGSALGSLLLWVRMPVGWHVACAAVLAFCFAYYLRRNYALAVFFVTLMIVLMTEAMMPVHLDFTVERLLATLAGGALALLAAALLWPQWEQALSPKILAEALRANRGYLDTIAARLAAGQAFTGTAIVAKREAERANSRAAASLQRLLGEPTRLQNNVEQTAALTTYNQRLTRAITVLGQQLNQRAGIPAPCVPAAVAALGESIEMLAAQLEAGSPAAVGSPQRRAGTPAEVAGEDAPIYGQIARIRTEIEAMALAAGEPAGASAGCQ